MRAARVEPPPAKCETPEQDRAAIGRAGQHRQSSRRLPRVLPKLHGSVAKRNEASRGNSAAKKRRRWQFVKHRPGCARLSSLPDETLACRHSRLLRIEGGGRKGQE